MEKCSSCGATLAPGATECKYCGGTAVVQVPPQANAQQYQQPYNAPNMPPPPQYNQYGNPYGPSYNTPGQVIRKGKNKVAAGLLGIFLGGIGVHKFYLDQVGMGILYLIFCWTFIPALVGFIEGIIYLTMSDEAFIAKYDSKVLY